MQRLNRSQKHFVPVEELEREVADFCGVNRAVCLNSQTACAEMTLRVLGVGEGDEVIAV